MGAYNTQGGTKGEGAKERSIGMTESHESFCQTKKARNPTKTTGEPRCQPDASTPRTKFKLDEMESNAHTMFSEGNWQV